MTKDNGGCVCKKIEADIEQPTDVKQLSFSLSSYAFCGCRCVVSRLTADVIFFVADGRSH